MREIKYRARRKDNGKWAYGLPYYSYGSNDWMITRSNAWQPSYLNPDEGESTEHIPVDPETIVQFTGLKDKNGVDIYEGDIVSQYCQWAGGYLDDDGGESETIGCVSIVPSRGATINKAMVRDLLECETGYKKSHSVNVRGCRCIVIGNIHETPELLPN